MREETADTMVELLTAAIDDGIASRRTIPGYTVAGKTGTAQVAGPVKGGQTGTMRRATRYEYQPGSTSMAGSTRRSSSSCRPATRSSSP